MEFTANNISSPHVAGRHSYGVPRIFGDRARVVIGNFCSIAQNVTILVGVDHCSRWVTTYPFTSSHCNKRWGIPYKEEPLMPPGDVVIGNDVWIGFGATIHGGVTIGDGAVIGACAVVRRDVSPYAVMVGNPAKLVRFRFEGHIIELLLKIKWWNWPDEKIQKNIDLLCNPPSLGKLLELI